MANRRWATGAAPKMLPTPVGVFTVSQLIAVLNEVDGDTPLHCGGSFGVLVSSSICLPAPLGNAIDERFRFSEPVGTKSKSTIEGCVVLHIERDDEEIDDDGESE